MHPGEYWQSLELLGGVKSGEGGSLGGRNAEKTGETTPAVGGSLCICLLPPVSPPAFGSWSAYQTVLTFVS